MKKTLAMLLVIILSLSIISACDATNEESGAGATSDNSSITSEANSSEEESTESSNETSNEESVTETSDETSTPSETSDDTSMPDETDETLAEINEKLDIILSNADSDSSADALIAEHSDEFNAIVDLGEEAIESLHDIIVESTELLRINVAYKAFNTIRPIGEENSSHNDKYSLQTFYTGSFWISNIESTFYRLLVVNNESNSVIFASEDHFEFINASWSPDDRYVSVHSGSRYGRSEDIIDVLELKMITLPNIDEINNSNVIKPNDEDIEVDIDNTYLDEWLEDNRIKVKIEWVMNYYEPVREGWYIYDLVEGEIEEGEIVNVLDN